MINKSIILKRIEEINCILGKYDLQTVLEENMSQLTGKINEYAFRILMIGGFNAGKSAFLNTLLDRNILKEAQSPKTTIATELIYDEREYIEAIHHSGSVQCFSLSEIEQLSPQDWDYLVCHLKNDFLKEHPDIILVDMPGIDSNVEWHNKAISQYISKGSAYILMVSCEDGTIKQSTADFIKEVAKYPQSLTCFVSQCDLKLPADYDIVVEHVREEVQYLYGAPISTTPISIYDAQFKEKVSQEIEAFHPQELFEQKFSYELNALINIGKEALHTAKDALSLDTKEIDQKIKECAQKREEIQKNFHKDIKDLEKKYSNQVVPSILSDLEGALTERTDQLTTAITMGKEAFNAVANSIIRPVLYQSTNQHIENSFTEFVDHRDLFSLDQKNENLKESIPNSLQIISDHLTKIQGIQTVDKQRHEEAMGAYRSIASIVAIATDFINPVLELAIVFLPTILDIVANLDRQAKLDDLKNKVRVVVIPEIIEKITPQVESAVSNIRHSMLEALETQVSEMLAAQEAALTAAKEEKAQIAEDFQLATKTLEQDLEKLEALKM